MTDLEFPPVRAELPEPAVKCVAGPDSATDIWLFPAHSDYDPAVLCHAIAVLWEGGVRAKQVLPILKRIWRRHLLPPMAVMVGVFKTSTVGPGISIVFDLPEGELLEKYRREISRMQWAWSLNVVVTSADAGCLQIALDLDVGLRYVPGTLPPSWEPGGIQF
jgi:hypothetical protein